MYPCGAILDVYSQLTVYILDSYVACVHMNKESWFRFEINLERTWWQQQTKDSHKCVCIYVCIYIYTINFYSSGLDSMDCLLCNNHHACVGDYFCGETAAYLAPFARPQTPHISTCAYAKQVQIEKHEHLHIYTCIIM